MNTNSDNLPLDDLRFDQLADGELSEQERRELLTGLDDEPGGWRRCALAFLESQCWKQTFGAIAQENIPGVVPAKALRLARSHWPSRLGTLLAMAACFLAAFWVGSLVEQAHLDRPVAPAGATGEVATTAGVSPQAHAAANPWRMVTVSAPAGRSVSLPAVERDKIDQQWLQSLPPAMPENVRRAFSRTGHQIEQRRELVPVPLQDGRQLVVPVDRVDVHYVGNGTY